MSGCERFLGMRYRYGGDGSDGYIDCIHLVYGCLQVLKVPTPKFKQSWYGASAREVLKDINSWGIRIDRPRYDGDIIVLPDPETSWSFGVTWRTGLLTVHPSQRVIWTPSTLVPISRAYRYCRTNAP